MWERLAVEVPTWRCCFFELRQTSKLFALEKTLKNCCCVQWLCPSIYIARECFFSEIFFFDRCFPINYRVVTRIQKTHRVCVSWWSKQRYWSIPQKHTLKEVPQKCLQILQNGLYIKSPAVSSSSLTIYSAWLGLSGVYMLCLSRGLPCTYYIAWSMITSLLIIALFRHAKRCSWDAVQTLILCQGSEDLKWFWRYVIFLYFAVVLCGEKDAILKYSNDRGFGLIEICFAFEMDCNTSCHCNNLM